MRDAALKVPIDPPLVNDYQNAHSSLQSRICARHIALPVTGTSSSGASQAKNRGMFDVVKCEKVRASCEECHSVIRLASHSFCGAQPSRASRNLKQCLQGEMPECDWTPTAVSLKSHSRGVNALTCDSAFSDRYKSGTSAGPA